MSQVIAMLSKPACLSGMSVKLEQQFEKNLAEPVRYCNGFLTSCKKTFGLMKFQVKSIASVKG